MSSVVWRLVRGGLLAALLVGLAGWAVGRFRFGASNEAALAGVEAEVRQRFEASADTLGALASAVSADPALLRSAARDTTATRRLFELTDAALPDHAAGRTGITVYDAASAPIAWAGRVTDMPRDRILGPAALFVAPGTLGPRLVRIEPVTVPGRGPTSRIATIVVEQSLGSAGPEQQLGDTLVIETSLVPVSLRIRPPGTVPQPGPYRFAIPSKGGGLLVDAEVSAADLDAASAYWRHVTWSGVGVVLAVMLVLCAGPVAEWRRGLTASAGRRPFVAATATLAALILAARSILWFAAAPLVSPPRLTSAVDLPLTAAAATSLVWLLIDTLARLRLAGPRRRVLDWSEGGRPLQVAIAHAVAGIAAAVLLLAYERFLERVVATTTLDVLHFSLHPIGMPRLAVGFGLVLMHAAVIWLGASAALAAGALHRPPRLWQARVTSAGAWLVAAALTAGLMNARVGTVPVAPLFAALAVSGICAALLVRLRRRARRASQAARLGALFLALLVPAVAMYPSLLAIAAAAKERLVATTFAPVALSQREDLQLRLRSALEEIDAQSSLADLLVRPDGDATTDSALVLWKETDLSRYHLTSAVELYAADGDLVSRFALNLPEYTTTRVQAPSCDDWDLLDEVSPFGSSERHVLRASRAVCERRRHLGSIVVRVMLDYRTLPFIASQSPYLESLRPDRQPSPESAPGRDIEFVAYGWSRAPLFASGTSVWPLSDPVFQQMADARTPVWDTVRREGDRYRVLYLNDRGGIYALGYPVITWFGQLVNLAELVTLTVVLYLVLLAISSLATALSWRAPASPRALLREVRSSFYRKLFLAFVFAAAVPVLILAVATRAYVAAQLRAGVDELAAQTAMVAQRLVEDYATLQQRGAGSFEELDDQIMVLVSRAIDQDVNLFDRARLQATNQRDLFASNLFSTRTPGEVYRSIVLDRLPTFVGEQQVGDFRYTLAAAPIRAGGHEGVVTVPLTLRQQQIERQIDDLDRRVVFAAVLFSLLGAALGYWMAERIADPVNRLTRATRRIARGDLDARMAATSADELGRLVNDFNQMAADLKRQRTDLERTQRLEAWADMARQVAHDIKNPLTPIQLAAEHARRVNADRGGPLSPVLDDCVTAILTQVKLLRQLSAEFSSFASSPTARPEPTDVVQLLEEVLAPYRTALAGRVALVLDATPELPLAHIDRTLFGRALTNIIENALHAMPGDGRLTVTAHRATTVGRPVIVVAVSDTGVGMDAEAVARVFEPYFSTKTTGTGLGLTIAKRNVELNLGAIHVSSARGAGTTVTLSVPIA